MLAHPVKQLAAIGAINPDTTQLLARSAHSLEQLARTFGIRNRGSRDDHRQHQTERVNQQVAFATLHHLAVVKAALAAHACGFDTLAVQTACRRMFVMTSAATHVCPQAIVDALPRPVIAPNTKIMVDTFPVRVIFGQHAPLGASYQNIQDRIDDLTHVQAAWPTTGFSARNQIFDTIPVAVSQIGRVCLCLHTPNVHYSLS
ncbi:hypothetical protein SE17_01495 [Kouleothrix aurantiaca]|uniref:Uncharacterized protein n=1 Tax=Kouleothrix aurantiaca TaxID=186479 RepID=A0A0P9DMY2_9CHLR|nr:hypothetical protein SE17_01495 [Kouleothrix aurantiaca]